MPLKLPSKNIRTSTTSASSITYEDNFKDLLVKDKELAKDNYEIAVDMLDERYGKKRVMIDVHYAKILNLPVAIYKPMSLRSLCNITDKHLHCLRSPG